MSHFRLLEGQTFEWACEHGAMYVSRDGREMFTLYPKAVQRLGGIPQPEVAWMMLRMIEEAKP